LDPRGFRVNRTPSNPAAQPTEALLHRLFDAAGEIPLSFELFPPRTAAGRASLAECVDHLAEVATGGFSVTMGAGGSTRSDTHETAVEIQNRTGRPVTAHLTALGLSRDDALATAEALWRDGITRILALRGDRPRVAQGPLPPGFAHAAELVAALRARHDFEIAVAAHPEKHPEADTLDDDIDHLKEKLDAGATMAVCQFVLDPAAYGRFLDACGRHGITTPVVPGLMPLEQWGRIRSFGRANGARIPEWLDRLLTGHEETPEVARLIAATATMEQARRLIAYGAPALHVYTLNRWQLPLALARMLGHTHYKNLPVALD